MNKIIQFCIIIYLFEIQECLVIFDYKIVNLNLSQILEEH